MKTKEKITGICPKCGKAYSGRPALSRVDGKTNICPDCGILEALQTLGINETEQQEILNTIHNTMKGGKFNE